jgi:hypothetical protein
MMTVERVIDYTQNEMTSPKLSHQIEFSRFDLQQNDWKAPMKVKEWKAWGPRPYALKGRMSELRDRLGV